MDCVFITGGHFHPCTIPPRESPCAMSLLCSLWPKEHQIEVFFVGEQVVLSVPFSSVWFLLCKYHMIFLGVGGGLVDQRKVEED